MPPLNVVYLVALVLGVAMFAASWVIRRKQISEGPIARAEKPLMLLGAGLTFAAALFGFIVLF